VLSQPPKSRGRAGQLKALVTAGSPLGPTSPEFPISALPRARNACRSNCVFAGVLRLTDAVVELPQAETAVGDKRTHAVQFGESKSLLVVTCAAFGIELVWMGC